MMKKYILAGMLVVMMSTAALADWLVDFHENYDTNGIDIAVEKAIEAGTSPNNIVESALAYDPKLNPQNLIKALYCAGAKGDDVRAAALNNALTDQIVVAGFEKSVEECGDQVVDTQAYTPAMAQGPSLAGLPSVSGSSAYASPSVP